MRSYGEQSEEEKRRGLYSVEVCHGQNSGNVFVSDWRRPTLGPAKLYDRTTVALGLGVTAAARTKTQVGTHRGCARLEDEYTCEEWGRP
jgi:hypothetical protein